MAVWIMDGINFTGGATVKSVAAGWRAVGAGDINGDGKNDIIWQNTDGRMVVWYMNGTNFQSGAVFANQLSGAAWRVSGVGDLDGNGKIDFVMRYIP